MDLCANFLYVLYVFKAAREPGRTRRRLGAELGATLGALHPAQPEAGRLARPADDTGPLWSYRFKTMAGLEQPAGAARPGGDASGGGSPGPGARGARSFPWVGG